MNWADDLTNAAHLLRDGTVDLGPVSEPLSVLLYRAADRLGTQLLSWQHATIDTADLVEGVFGPELAVAREVKRQAGLSGGG